MTVDWKWNGRDLVVDETGAAVTVDGNELLEQLIGIESIEQLSDAIGGVTSDETLRQIETRLQRIAEEQSDVGQIQRINLLEIDKSTDTVTVAAVYSQSESSEIEIQI